MAAGSEPTRGSQGGSEFFLPPVQLNHDLYEVMGKLDKQHSSKVFIIKGVSRYRGRLMRLHRPLPTGADGCCTPQALPGVPGDG